MIVLCILIGIIVLFILSVLIRAASTSDDSLIQTQIVINKPCSEVFDCVKLLDTQSEYNVWVMKDPNIKRLYTGTDGTISAMVAWEGNNKVGKGEQEITGIIEGKRIDWQLRFEKPMKNVADAWMELQTVSPVSTKVIWAFASKLTFMMKVTHVALNLPKLLRKDMETSLNNLKKYPRKMMATEDKQKVGELMAALEHPLKAEIEALRDILKNTNNKIAERVKWNSPSYYYKVDLAAFHLRQQNFVHLIVVFPKDTTINDSTGLLEANHKDRREAKFYNMQDIANKQPALEKIINTWVSLVDDTPPGHPYIFNS